MRDLVAETNVTVSDLIAPLFVREGISDRVEISSLPGVYQDTRDSLRRDVAGLAELGVRAVMLFGVPAEKDPTGSGASDPDGIVQLALGDLRAEVGDDVVLITALCVDESTSHGHCGIVRDDGTRVAIRLRVLSEDAICFVNSWWQLPAECRLTTEGYQLRDWTATTFTWKASALCHKPLYFEDAQLERYGHSAGPIKQPLLSGAHFFANVALLPYNMGLHPPNECRYALGYYRPGSCAPWVIPAFPLSIEGAAMQTMAVTGLIGILP